MSTFVHAQTERSLSPLVEERKGPGKLQGGNTLCVCGKGYLQFPLETLGLLD